MTGTTLPECLGFVRVLVDRPSSVMGRVTKVVIDGPTPLPQALFEARRCARGIVRLSLPSGLVQLRLNLCSANHTQKFLTAYTPTYHATVFEAVS